ncbi:hypothetical protein BU26DRAFT_592384, partial [Trematosphaeria pertusa]
GKRQRPNAHPRQRPRAPLGRHRRAQRHRDERRYLPQHHQAPSPARRDPSRIRDPSAHQRHRARCVRPRSGRGNDLRRYEALARLDHRVTQAGEAYGYGSVGMGCHGHGLPAGCLVRSEEDGVGVVSRRISPTHSSKAVVYQIACGVGGSTLASTLDITAPDDFVLLHRHVRGIWEE